MGKGRLLLDRPTEKGMSEVTAAREEEQVIF